jgi:hypothetical protein
VRTFFLEVGPLERIQKWVHAAIRRRRRNKRDEASSSFQIGLEIRTQYTQDIGTGQTGYLLIRAVPCRATALGSYREGR